MHPYDPGRSMWARTRHQLRRGAPRRVKGYPTVKAFVNGRDAGDYSGERTAAAAKAWALGLVPNHITSLNRQPQARRCRPCCHPTTHSKQ